MPTMHYAETLVRKHKLLDEQLSEAYLMHLPDSDILILKKQKLALKDEIARLHMRQRRKLPIAA